MEKPNSYRTAAGKFLTAEDRKRLCRERKRRSRKRHARRYLTLVLLLTADGILLYMLMGNLVDIRFGAGFLAAVSIWIGYQIKQEE